MPAALNVPNAITLVRFALVPAIAQALLAREHGLAFALFVASAVSDVADGYIARRWNLRTRFGAIADPLADKLTMLTVSVLLAWRGALPIWFALAVVARDALIVGGALAYHLRHGAFEMAPTRVSKLNTGLEFALLLGVLAVGAGLVADGAWLDVLLFATLATIAWSGLDYVLVWSRKAAQARRATAPH
jgi:cardiolipin synthase